MAGGPEVPRGDGMPEPPAEEKKRGEGGEESEGGK
jgi:hypothetical protein